MTQVYRDTDLGAVVLQKETIAVIGFGIQGGPQACNMRESGMRVVVGARRGGPSWQKAQQEGCSVMEIPDAVRSADIIHILVPDMVQAELYRTSIAPHLRNGQALGFAHGAAIHWKWIVPPPWVDVIMLAPKAPGQRMRELYLQGGGVPALVAVYQDYTGRAWDRVFTLAKGTGCSRAGLVKTTFAEEVESDWFGEQVDLCGGIDRLLRTAFEVLVEAGYQPEVAYFEVLHEMKLIVDLIQRYGISGMYQRVSETARYGGLTRGERAIGPTVKEAMRAVLREVRSGAFAREWKETYDRHGTEAFAAPLRALEQHPIERVGRQLRQQIWPE